MILRRSGVILFTGATSSVRGRQGAPDFSSAKFGLRGLAEALAAELWPKGIHVAHVVIDGMIDTPAVRRKHRPKARDPPERGTLHSMDVMRKPMNMGLRRASLDSVNLKT